MPDLTYLQAITAALRSEMARDSSVYVIGEDVAEGGPYGATKGLAAQFGANRVRNTPISEATITGLATGAAVAGFRPVVEIMFFDFITLALDQLVNQAAKLRYMSGGQLSVPLVIRTQGGAGYGGAAQHSQMFESWLTHVPGLKVVMPSTAADAAGLLVAAIRDDDPVVFVENKALYGRSGVVSDPIDPVPLGRASVVRPGDDVTVVATSRIVIDALAAAEQLAGEGISVEVVDPRSLLPLDFESIAESVRKTHRLVIAHEAVTSAGWGAELAARVSKECFDDLDAPVERVGAPFSPVPFSPALERAWLPASGAIRSGVRAVLPHAPDVFREL